MILAGGKGTRMSEITKTIPKPMVNIGNKPLLMHIIDIYRRHSFKDFIVAAGYKSDYIKRYFYELLEFNGNLEFDFNLGKIIRDDKYLQEKLDINLTVVDSGVEVMTGGRIKACSKYLSKTFLATYGDGIGNIDISSLVKFHRSHNKIATMTIVRQPSRYGKVLKNEFHEVSSFSEKSSNEEPWINAGFFVFNDKLFDFIDSDQTILEVDVLPHLAAIGQLMAHSHEGFWHGVDSLRDIQIVEETILSGKDSWLAE